MADVAELNHKKGRQNPLGWLVLNEDIFHNPTLIGTWWMDFLWYTQNFHFRSG